MKLRVLQIVPGTSVDGPGLRTSIYLAGCSHACPGCHNPSSWSFHGGTEMEVSEILNIIDAHGFNVTLTGGDPLQTPNLEALRELAQGIRTLGYGIWCYTGYTIDEINANSKLKEIISLFDAIVEGPFIEALKTQELPFRGSSNQKIIEVRASE